MECDFGDSNPPPQVSWFADDTRLQEIQANNDRLFLEGGRYLYIRALTATERGMRYHCEIDNFRENGMPRRAPTTYILTERLPIAGINVFKELGIMTAQVGEPIRFLYAAVARDMDDNFVDFTISCPRNDPLVILSVIEQIIMATLREAAGNESQVNFTCQVGIFGSANLPNTITGKIIVSSKSNQVN